MSSRASFTDQTNLTSPNSALNPLSPPKDRDHCPSPVHIWLEEMANVQETESSKISSFLELSFPIFGEIPTPVAGEEI